MNFIQASVLCRCGIQTIPDLGTFKLGISKKIKIVYNIFVKEALYISSFE